MEAACCRGPVTLHWFIDHMMMLKPWFHYMGVRVWMRWFVIRYALASLLFWTVALIIGAWLQAAGLGLLWWVLSLVWLYFAIPPLWVQTQSILDVIVFVLTRQTYFYHQKRLRLAELQLAQEPARVQQAVRRLRPVFRFVSATTPLAALSTWAVIVLARMPADAHAVREPRTKTSMRHAIQSGREIEFVTAAKWTDRWMANVLHQ